MAQGDRGRFSALRSATAPLVAVAVAIAVAPACSGNHHILSPEGKQAKSIALIAWFMFISAGAVTLLVFAALLHGMFRRHRTTRRGEPRRFVVGEQTWIIAGGVALPLVFIGILTAMSLHGLPSEAKPDAVAITVVGHQYWWEVQYPGLGVTTAEEIHVPVGRDVDVTLLSDDVIHSFWVPDLAGKIDMIPGQTNHLTLHADKAGTYRGQCAEFCGLQHANMIFFVVADEPSTFDAWVRSESGAAPAPAPGTPAADGAIAFQELPCASCHTIKGTAANGTAGPDLTHFANRSTIGAGTVPNTPGYLGGWIADAQSTKPGSLMPPIPMRPDQLNALLAYLGTLK